MRVFALPVGGGILAISPVPGGGGDYAGDLQHLAEWKPAMVLTLVTDVELLSADAQTLGQDLQDTGTRWVHMPIVDYGFPGPDFETRWPEVSQQAQRALQGGGRVLIHCRGGCGRSGMVALRLMIETGDAPDDALARLRSIRPCAVETGEQLAWAREAKRKPAVFVRHDG